jgi:hypothetical protein
MIDVYPVPVYEWFVADSAMGGTPQHLLSSLLVVASVEKLLAG